MSGSMGRSMTREDDGEIWGFRDIEYCIAGNVKHQDERQAGGLFWDSAMHLACMTSVGRWRRRPELA